MKRCFVALLILVTWGCDIDTIEEDEVYEPIQKPEKVKASGVYVHQPSGIQFPERMVGLKRVTILRYDKNGFDVSANYDPQSGLKTRRLSIYVFPDPETHRLRMLGHRVNLGPEELASKLEKRFQRTKNDITKKYSGLKMVGEGRSTLYEGKTGKRVTYSKERNALGRTFELLTETHLFLSKKGWFLKYRITYPSERKEKVREKLKNVATQMAFPGQTAAASGETKTRTTAPPVITEREQLDRYVGEKMTIRGTVTNTKIPTIRGVDIRSRDPDLRGERAEATGILKKHVVTEEDLEKKRKKSGGRFSNRGPGTFYRLESVNGDGLAQVQPVGEKE